MTETIEKKGGFERFIKWIERVGNKLPHPFWLFIILSGIVFALSYMLEGVSVTYMAASAGKAPTEAKAAVVNLLSYDALRTFLAGFVRTYVNFAPLGLILTMMLGIGIVEQSGMISALMRKTVLGAPNWLVTTAIVLVGINSNLASDAGIIFTPVIAAAVYKALGRNPWVGIVVGYAVATGAFTANMFVAGTDALLAGITKSAIEGVPFVPADVPVHPLINYYYMCAAAVVLTVVTVYVAEKYTSKMLEGGSGVADAEELKKHVVTPAENRGLLWGFFALVLYVGLIVYLTYPQGSLFRANDGAILPSSPLLTSIVPVLFFLFFFVGIAYGYGAGTIKKGEDIPKLMGKGIAGTIGFIVVVLPASMFVELFRLSRFDVILSVKGANVLKALNLDNFPLLVLLLFILLVTFLNFFIFSGSAKWLILAPVFVPMFAQIGFSPALVQVAYRIGDSPTNCIAPINYYLPVIIGLLEQYKKEGDPEVRIGTVISMTMPYAIFYTISFVALFVVWYFAGWELGPGVQMFMPK